MSLATNDALLDPRCEALSERRALETPGARERLNLLGQCRRLADVADARRGVALPFDRRPEVIAALVGLTAGIEVGTLPVDPNSIDVWDDDAYCLAPLFGAALVAACFITWRGVVPRAPAQAASTLGASKEAVLPTAEDVAVTPR